MTLSIKIVRQILNSVDAYSILFHNRRVVLANTKVLDWSTLSEDELNEYIQTDCIHPSSQGLLENTYKKLLAGEDNLSVKIIAIHPKIGNILIDAKVKKANYFNDDNYWLVTFFPVSQHISYSLSTPQQMQVFDNQDLIEHNFFLTNVIREHRFTDNALNSFLVTLQDIIPYDSASITLLEAGELHFIASRGLAIDIFNFAFKPSNALFQNSDILYENDFGKAYIINNVSKNPTWVVVDGTNHIKSWMGVELNYEGEMLGLINIDSAQDSFFTQDHARHALALAQQATLAIVYTRLHQQFKNDFDERNHLQKILVRNLINIQASYATQELLSSSDSLEESLPELMNVVTSSLGRTQLFLVIFNLPTGKVLHKLSSFDAPNNIWDVFAEVVQNKTLPNDTMPTTDWALPPDSVKKLEDGRKILVAHVNRRGALIALREADTPEFNELDYELITSVATQIDIALENELLNLQLRQHNEQLEKQIERRTTQLSFERKRLKAILDATAEGIFYMEDFTIRYANPTFCRMVGYGIDDLYGKPLSYVRVSPENSKHRSISNILDNLQEIESGRSETRLRHQDGTEFYASIRFSLVGQPGESPVRMVAIARDISQERKLFFQRARFIANAAHELRTPLSSIILRLHMLRRQPERMETHLESLDRVTEYLREIVEELLTLSRFERGTVTLEKQQYPLQKIINESIDEQRPFAIEQEVSINIDLPPEEIIISVDYKRIHQMLGNLVLNAINYSDKKDTVDIIMSVEEDIIGNKNAVILIIDEGAGIEAELLPDDIFEPFSRPSGGTRKETGMGLSLVREIANLHGGNIQVTSVLGEGATFRISIPID